MKKESISTGKYNGTVERFEQWATQYFIPSRLDADLALLEALQNAKYRKVSQHLTVNQFRGLLYSWCTQKGYEVFPKHPDGTIRRILKRTTSGVREFFHIKTTSTVVDIKFSTNDKYFEIIDRKTFLNEEAYSDFLFQFEIDQGKIDHVIQRKPKYRTDLIVLEIIMEKEVES